MNKQLLLLWLDDYRDPFLEREWLRYSPIPAPFEVIWVKSYNEFVEWIEENGLPDGICFDHDLDDEHYHPDMYVSPESYNQHYGTFKEKTGYEAAKWLVDYCLDTNSDLPKFNVHSFNPVGKENIRGLLINYNKIRNEK